MKTLLGHQLSNRYQLLAEVGRGGMGVVYQTHDAMLRRTVAVKVLTPQLVADPSFVQRFRHEAVAAASLRHPNIATVYDVGEDSLRGERIHYLVMEFIEGETLDRVLQREGRPFTLSQTDAIVRQVADALGYAHQRSMIHRDVKPANIMLSVDGHVTLMDFGLVRAGDASQLTQTGTVLGTPAYMAPEQIMDAQVDRRADIYALGVVIYELLTGDVPFRRTTPLAMVHAQVYDAPPPLRERRPDLPASVESVVLHALVKNPGGRYQEVSRLAADFSRAITGQMPDGLAEEQDQQAAPLSDATIQVPAPVRPVAPAAVASAAPRSSPAGPAPPGPPPVQPARARRVSPWLWIAIGLALAAVGLGAVVALGGLWPAGPVVSATATLPLPQPPPDAVAAAETPTATARAASDGPAALPANTPSATNAVVLTSTPIPPSPTPAALLTAQAQVIGDVLNVRGGPGTEYAVAGQIRRDETYQVVGRNANSSWWQICCLSGEAGWIASNLVRISGPAESVAVVEAAPPAATNTPTATALPAPSPTPCALPTGPTFVRVWNRELMGCPLSNESGVTSAFETFERGFMLWRKDIDSHFVVFDDGAWSRFSFPPAEPVDFACPEAAQLGRPRRGFSQVWCGYPEVRQRIGNALDDEIGNDRPLQAFQQGFMGFIPERNAIYALLDSGSWRRFD